MSGRKNSSGDAEHIENTPMWRNAENARPGRPPGPEKAPRAPHKRPFHPKCVIDLIDATFRAMGFNDAHWAPQRRPALSPSSGFNPIQHGDRIISRFQISNAPEIKSKGWNQAFRSLHANRHERADCLINGDRRTRNSNSATVRTLLYSCTSVARIGDPRCGGWAPGSRRGRYESRSASRLHNACLRLRHRAIPRGGHKPRSQLRGRKR